MTSWIERPLLSVDTETTGLDPFSDRIVSLAAIAMAPGGEVMESWSTLVDPGVEIPAATTAIHGITTEQAREQGVSPADAIASLYNLVRGASWRYEPWPVVIMNVRFDWPLILAEAARHGVEFPVATHLLDPLIIDRWVRPHPKGGRKLVNVLGFYDVHVEVDEATAAHGACADAEAAGHVMRQIVAHYPHLAELSLTSLYLHQVREAEAQRQGFVDWMRRNRDAGFDGSPPGWPVPVRAEKPKAQPVALNAKDIAMAGAKAFPGESQQRRFRYALTFAATGGRAKSAKDLNPRQLHNVHEHLVDLAEGRMRYDIVGTEGVRFWWPAGDGTTVLWSQLEADPASAGNDGSVKQAGAS